MFRVLGIDKKEYGPVSADVVRRWLREGRANAHTQVRAEGTPDWKPLAEFPEFAALLSPGTRPPPLPPRVPSSRPAPAKNCGQAVASLVFGILALPTCGLTALIGLPLGILALKKIKKSGGRLGGQGLAIAGICVSGLLVLLLPIDAAILLPAIAQERSQANRVACMNNLRQLGMAMRMYANDQSDRFALASNWCDALQSYVSTPQAYVCKSGPSGQRCHFGYNARLSGLEEGRIDPKTVLFFEVDGGWNISGGPERVLHKPRHMMLTICYADGSVEQVHPSRLPQLRWSP